MILASTLLTVSAAPSLVGTAASLYGASKSGETDPVPSPADFFKLGTTGSRAGTSFAGRQAAAYLDYLRQKKVERDLS
jgi:hypothetical protein